MRMRTLAAIPLLILVGLGTSARCGDLTISTGDPDFKMAMATRPDGNGKIEIETGDDFILSQTSLITNVTFTGLISENATGQISQVVVEIYRVFPQDSTSPPSGNVPTRDNSPCNFSITPGTGSSGLFSAQP